MYIPCLEHLLRIDYVYTKDINFRLVTDMNLRAAQKELRSRTPQVNAHTLALETVFVVSVSFILVGIFT